MPSYPQGGSTRWSADNIQRIGGLIGRVKVLRHVPLDTKYAISDTFLFANLSAGY